MADATRGTGVGARAARDGLTHRWFGAVRSHFWVHDAGWKESEHPRGGDPEHPGRFSEAGGGAGASKTQAPSKEREEPEEPAKEEPHGRPVEPAPQRRHALISTRRPGGVAAPPEGDYYKRADIEAMRAAPKDFFNKAMDLLRNPEAYPNFKKGELDD